MIATVTPLEALRRLLDASKLIDFADCKDETVWQALGAAQSVAEGVVRDYVEPVPVAYANAAFFISRKSEFAQNGTVIFPAKCGEVTMPLYAAPVAAQPPRTALGDELLAAIEAMQLGCTSPSFIGWQNGDGEEVGTRLQTAIDAYKAARPSDPEDMAANYDHTTHGKRMEVLGAMREELEVQPSPDVVLEAAINWWKGLRPVGWSEASHLCQPAVNASTGRGAKLALAVAAYVSAPTAAVSAASSGEVELSTAMADGYEGGTMFSNPGEIGATINLHYSSTACAENAFDVISNAIDAAITATKE